MNISGLSFEALPPISIPFRFFLAAPLFALLSAFLILYSGQDIWLSRWHPTLLAVTHGFTMGFLASAMLGALIQILPVVSGIGFYKVKLVGTFCHLLHLAGTLALIANFIAPNKILLIIALACLALGFTLYGLSAFNVVLKKLSQGATIIGIRFAVIAMMVTAGLGIMLLARSYGIGWLNWLSYDKGLTDLHAIWGGIGWASMLIIAVSFQVIPMFHVAPQFPKLVSRYLPLGLFLTLLFLSLTLIAGNYLNVLAIILLVICCLYSLGAWQALKQRKRKIPDTTVMYWQLAFASLFVIFMMCIIPIPLMPEVIQSKYSLLVGAAFGYFFLISIIQGMLLKIMPFLSYTHLQQRCLSNFEGMQYLPNMHEFLAKHHAKYLFYMHVTSGLLLLLTIIFPVLYQLLAVSLIVEFSWLLFLMMKTVNRYQQSLVKITALENKSC